VSLSALFVYSGQGIRI